MEAALHLPNVSRSVVIPLVAALLGAGAGIGAYALADNEPTPAPNVTVLSPAGNDSTPQPVPMSGHRP